MSETIFKGYAVKDGSKWDEFEVIEYQPKNWEETDVELAITHCGVCGSDVHTINGGWGGAKYPIVVGHEIVGKVIRVGSQVKDINVGDRVGVGAQISACYDCRACNTENENYCPKQLDTYNHIYPDGVKTMGGYSTAIRANHRFVFPIPDGVESKHAASMLCAGLTVYSPLVRNGCGPGKRVAVIGIGGLGHYAILFAKALGAEVTALTHSKRKVDDIKQLGADHVIVTGDDPDFHKPFDRHFDIIVCTRDSSHDMPLTEYLSMLWVNGKFVVVGLPDDPLPGLDPFALISNGANIGGSHIGSKAEALEMLKLAAEKGVKPWIEELPMKEVGTAVRGVSKNKARYRYVLTQDLV